MFTLNQNQQFVVDRAIDWYYNSSDQVFEYDGCAGSGKSVVLNEIVKRLGLNPLTEIAPMSFIGSASLVMRMKGLISAKTAHSWIFDVIPVPLLDKHGNVIMDELLNKPIMVPKFIPIDKLNSKIKLIVIDEAYSMPLKLRPVIEKFGVKIIACGDQNQLPPVNDYPAFLTDHTKIYHLTECMRQAGRDDIHYIANRVGAGLSIDNGLYDNSLVINRSDLEDKMLLWADMVICGTNKTRDYLNNKIRRLKGYTSKLPQYGEKVVCRNNNWLEDVQIDKDYKINLCNGLIGKVVNSPDVSSFDGKLFSMSFSPDLAPKAIFKNTRCNYKHMISDNDTRMEIRQTKWELGNKFEFAYAITAHIAQGSQFHNVVYIEERMPYQIQNAVNLVGASRADMKLVYVKNSFQ